MNIDRGAAWPFPVNRKNEIVPESDAAGAVVEKPKTDSKHVAGDDVNSDEFVVMSPDGRRPLFKRRRMTDAEVRMVVKQHAQGESISEIARRMGRTYATVSSVIARIKNEAVLPKPQKSVGCVEGAEAVMPLVRNSSGVLEDGYPHVLAEVLKNSMRVSELYDKPEVFISRLVASEIIRVLESDHE